MIVNRHPYSSSLRPSSPSTWIKINSHPSMSSLFKTKASSLAKISALPVLRSPADLYNEKTLPYDLQRKQLQGEGSLSEAGYFSNEHYQLAKQVAASRKQYRSLVEQAARKALASKEYIQWWKYLNNLVKQPAAQLSETQKQQIYEAMLTAKERGEQRLALNRFIKFGFEYSQAFRVDLPLHPVVIMKLVHPHFGYLNLVPNHSHYKLTHQQLFAFIQELNAVSLIRDSGNILHSSELLSFVLWKALSLNQALISTGNFVELLKIFKFRDISEENLKDKFAFSLREGELISREGQVRFNLFRQIFIDREL